MLNHPTLEQLRSLKLTGMAQAFSEQLELDTSDLSFEERLAILVEREAVTRDNKRLTTRLRNAKLRHQASIEDKPHYHWCNWNWENLPWMCSGSTSLSFRVHSTL